MKRLIILTCIIAISGTLSALAEVNMPSAPIYTKSSRTNSTTSTPTNTNSVKSQLDALAMSALKAAENRNEPQVQSYMSKMLDIGAEGLSSPQIIAKRTPQCPPIRMELNGRQLSGSLCAQIGYQYQGQEHWIGYCK